MTQDYKLTKDELSSLNLVEKKRLELIAALKAIAPEVINENVVDLDAFKKVLGGETMIFKERFGLNWFGNEEAKNKLQQNYPNPHEEMQEENNQTQEPRSEAHRKAWARMDEIDEDLETETQEWRRSQLHREMGALLVELDY
jgi:hypothetical protein